MIRFDDVESGDEAFVVIRRSGDTIGLAVFVANGSDVEVFAPIEIALDIAKTIEEIAGER